MYDIYDAYDIYDPYDIYDAYGLEKYAAALPHGPIPPALPGRVEQAAQEVARQNLLARLAGIVKTHPYRVGLGTAAGAGGIYGLTRLLRRGKRVKGARAYLNRVKEFVGAHPWRVGLGAAGLGALGTGAYLYAKNRNDFADFAKTSEFEKYAGASPKSVINWIKSHPYKTIAALAGSAGGSYAIARLLKRLRRAKREAGAMGKIKGVFGKARGAAGRIGGGIKRGVLSAREMAAAHPYRAGLAAAGLAGLGAYAYSRRHR